MSASKQQQKRLPQPKQNNKLLKTSGPSLWWSAVRKFVTSNEVPERDKILGLIRGRDFSALLKLVKIVASQQYATATETFMANQLAALVKKYPIPLEGTEFRPEERAMATFHAGEHSCKRTNQRLRAAQNLGRLSHASIIHDAQRWMRKAFGSVQPISHLMEECDFTGGANVGVTGKKVNWARKITSKLTCSASTVPFLCWAIWSNQSLRSHFLKVGSTGVECVDVQQCTQSILARVAITNYNQIELVNKTVETHRTIAKEPLGNGLVQNGIDKWMRKQLLRMGLDLSDQQYNQELARLGSLPGTLDPYVTIDLKNASGTQATEAVKLLLARCGDFFRILSSVRSAAYKVQDSRDVKSYEMFSSMGNGFCFPLETAVFASICYACYKHCGMKPDFTVYGDDIVVRQSVALLVIEVLKYLGFRHNVEKTFLFGPFKESCGADWFEGQDIRPVYMHEPLDDVREVHSVYNSSLRNYYTKTSMAEVRELLFHNVDPRRRLCRPDHTRVVARPRDTKFSATLGGADTAFHVPLDVFMSCRYARWIPAEQRWSWSEILTQSLSDDLSDMPESLQESLRYKAVLRGAMPGEEFALRHASRVRVVSNAPKRSKPANWCIVKHLWYCANNDVKPSSAGAKIGAPGSEVTLLRKTLFV